MSVALGSVATVRMPARPSSTYQGRITSSASAEAIIRVLIEYSGRGGHTRAAGQVMPLTILAQYPVRAPVRPVSESLLGGRWERFGTLLRCAASKSTRSPLQHQCGLRSVK